MMKKLLAGAMLSVMALSVHAATEADLKWDLSYQTALREHPINAREFMAFWPQQHPQRPIHDRLAQYDGEPISASLLIERPDGHTGDPHATWFIRTRSSAKMCSFHPKLSSAPCTDVDLAKTDRFIREVMNFRQLPDQASEENTIDSGKGLLNYMGYVSVYVDGKSLQRPIAVSEWVGVGNPQQAASPETGRLELAAQRLMLSDAEFAAAEAKRDARTRRAAFVEAVRRGDVNEMQRILDQSSDRGAALMAEGESPLSVAAASGQKSAIDFLLRRGQAINGGDSAAVRAAVRADKAEMVEYLLAKGARVDPPTDPRTPNERVSASPLSEAVDVGNEKMAILLIKRGAKPNINVKPSVLARAAGRLDYALVDLLLKNGAAADNLTSDEGRTALHAAVLSAYSPERAAGVEQIARRLVAAGANINYMTANCRTAYTIAGEAGQPALQAALLDMGADANIGKRCSELSQKGREGSREGAEAKARAAIAGDTRRMLRERDYAGLEKLHDKLNSDNVRTPSGIWGLAVFYSEIKNYPMRTRDLEYWKKEEARATEWETKFPKSAVAPQFHIYLLYNRALSFRGNGKYSEIRKEDIEPMNQAVEEAYQRIDKMSLAAYKKRGGTDANWYRVRLEVLPYSRNFNSHYRASWEGAAIVNPDYHEQYFSAAFYSLPMWGGAPDGVEQIARLAAKGKGTDREAMYARVYWNLDQIYYYGKLFEDSAVDWDDMKTSFDAMIKAYPDPWNLNAYAYFACKAGDYGVMSSLLKRIDEELVFSVWGSGGETEYRSCARNIGADTRNFKADLAARNKRFQEAQYSRLISYAIGERDRWRNEESLRALSAAGDLGVKLWGRAGMRVNYHSALTLHNLGRYDEERAALQEGLKSQPGYSSALFQMGMALEGLKRQDEARTQFAAAAEQVRIDVEKLGAERSADVQKEAERMRKKFGEYGIVVPGL
ncbi:hypothetical protein GTP45_23120 [Pseudoduganella sp. FT55W]|uniref:Ankyrin repeat domain-containing protein n=1 Tax=Duganella rivi TaxID=2666083 RepID=A0A7X4KE47_9BURK|nr:hypothetical protein [Duganella rivi]MYM69712.1 hypothetical protein [Duganella rivi]